MKKRKSTLIACILILFPQFLSNEAGAFRGSTTLDVFFLIVVMRYLKKKATDFHIQLKLPWKSVAFRKLAVSIQQFGACQF